jgi:hypothetical protein
VGPKAGLDALGPTVNLFLGGGGSNPYAIYCCKSETCFMVGLRHMVMCNAKLPLEIFWTVFLAIDGNRNQHNSHVVKHTGVRFRQIGRLIV